MTPRPVDSVWPRQLSAMDQWLRRASVVHQHAVRKLSSRLAAECRNGDTHTAHGVLSNAIQTIIYAKSNSHALKRTSKTPLIPRMNQMMFARAPERICIRSPFSFMAPCAASSSIDIRSYACDWGPLRRPAFYKTIISPA